MSAFAHLEYLVNRCGDRRMGTPGNELAAEYIAREMESLGFSVRLERFTGPGTVQGPYALAMALGFFASLLLDRRGRAPRFAGYLMAALMASLIAGECTTRFRPARFFLASRSGRNIVCEPDADQGGAGPSVLVVAHYDTINEGTSFHPRLVRYVPAGFYAYTTFPFLAVILSRPPLGKLARLFRLAMACGVTGMLSWQFLGRYNPGANDNGSGVAVALEVAGRMGGEEAARNRVWFLFTDGEEAGMEGMRSFCRTHRRAMAGTLIVNLESLGAGELSYLAREGMIRRVRPPVELMELVHEYASDSACGLRRRDDPAFNTDALAALARGLAAVTFVRLDENGMIPGWHFDDSLDRIEERALDETVGFIAGLTVFLARRSRDG